MSLRGYSLSVCLGPATADNGLTAYFTTYDGSTGLPLFDTVGGVILVSDELSPAGGGVYRTDYGLSQFGSWLSYGTATVNFPTTDSDGNGVPDFLQVEFPGSVAFSGSASEQVPAIEMDTVSGRLTRNAGSFQGDYTALIQGPQSSLLYHGSVFLANAIGTLTYTRGAKNQAMLQMDVHQSDGTVVAWTASQSFSVSSPNTVSFPAMTFSTSAGKQASVNSFSLTRSGKTYIGRVTLVDGDLLTSWNDYTQAVVEIEDTNDRDGNGIPDLSDALPATPTFTTQPKAQTVVEGQPVSFTVAATGSPTYQWYKNGALISGAVSATYSILNAASNDSGTYTVVAMNAGGSTTSSGALLTVTPAPKTPVITSQPLAQHVPASADVTFTVTVTGAAPMSYRWRKDGKDLPLETTTALTMRSVDVFDAGSYVVRVENQFGSTESTPAELEVFSLLSVTTLAGTPGLTNSVDGVGSDAHFNLPTGLGMDHSGNVYVADYGDHVIRRITRAGAVSTWAGQAGIEGSTDGPAHDARFFRPLGIAVDASENVYVAEVGNHTIRKITPNGLVSTFAGSATLYGSTDGIGNMARFYNPRGLAIDSAGNLFVADTLNHTIRRVTPNGAVSTIAGSAGKPGNADGSGTSAQFNSPSFVVLDQAGALYVSDSGNNTVRKISREGMVTTLAGTPGKSGSVDGSSSNALFNAPRGLAIDSRGNILVADFGNHTIREILRSGWVVTLAGSAGSMDSADGTGEAARFNNPYGILLDTSGNVLVTDERNSSFRVGSPVLPEQPALQIARSGHQVTLKWPSSAERFIPEVSDSLAGSGDWTISSEPSAAVGLQRVSTLQPANQSAFFRLRHW